MSTAAALSAADAAHELDCTDRTVRRACAKHGIGTKHGRDWLLTRGDIRRLKSVIRPSRGNPTGWTGPNKTYCPCADDVYNEEVQQRRRRKDRTMNRRSQPTKYGSRNAYKGVVLRKDLRLAIYLRDRFSCLLCLRDLSDAAPSDLTLDHVIPNSDGGSNRPGNLYLCCRLAER